MADYPIGISDIVNLDHVLMTTDYRHSKNNSALDYLLGQPMKDAISKTEYANDELFKKWFKVVACYDFAHAECDYVFSKDTTVKTDKLYGWVTTLAIESFKKFAWYSEIDGRKCFYEEVTEQEIDSNKLVKKREILEYLAEFERDPDSVNQWGFVSEFLTGVMIDYI